MPSSPLRAALYARYSTDRQRTRELLAELLGPVTLTRDDTGDWAEMEEPAARVALAGSTPLTVVAGARNLRCRRIQIRRG